MARVPDMTVDQLAEADRDLLKRNIALHRALTNSPNAARAFSGLGQFIRYGSRLDPRLRELAILQVGWLARSPYEWSHHVKIGYDFGVTDDDIGALIAESAGQETMLEPLARLVLRAARENAVLPTVCGAARERVANRLDLAYSEHLSARKSCPTLILMGFSSSTRLPRRCLCRW